MTQISLKLFNKLPLTRNENRGLSRAGVPRCCFARAAELVGRSSSGLNPKTGAWPAIGARKRKARGRLIRSQRCVYVRISDDLSKAFPIASGTRPPASLPFFPADHDRIVGVRCQS